LSACPSCVTGGGATLSAEFEFKLGQTGKDAGLGGTDPSRSEQRDDVPLAKFADGSHELCSVPVESV